MRVKVNVPEFHAAFNGKVGEALSSSPTVVLIDTSQAVFSVQKLG